MLRTHGFSCRLLLDEDGTSSLPTLGEWPVRVLSDPRQSLSFQAIAKVIDTGVGREGEITYSVGSSRQNVAILAHAFLHELQFGFEELEINVPYPEVVSLLEKMGLESETNMTVLVSHTELG